MLPTIFMMLFVISLVLLIVGLASPRSVLRWGSTRTRGRAIQFYGLAAIGFAILAGMTAPKDEEEKLITPSYALLDEDVYDAPIKTQIELRVLVSSEISKEGLRAVLNDLYASTKARGGFKHHRSPTHIAIYVYTSRKHAELGSAWIAMLQKYPSDQEPKITVKKAEILDK